MRPRYRSFFWPLILVAIGLIALLVDLNQMMGEHEPIVRGSACAVGRGFVNPIDDFRNDNPASHPKTLDFLADQPT